MTALEQVLCDMVAIDSTNPALSPGAPGERAFAQYFAGRLEAAGLEVDMWDVLPGRPNVVGRLRGSGGGKTLMLLGHLDVVAAADSAAFRPVIRDGNLHGRGAADMKAGFAAMVLVAEALAAAPGRLRGDLLLAGVIDEEWESAGAEALPARYRPDACILAECTGLDVVTEHGGFAWYQVTSDGVEAAGVDVEHGVDAIALLGPVLAGIAALDGELAARPRTEYGRPSIHASTIEGGSQYPAYPARCTLGVERCLIAGESVGQSRAEMERLLEAARLVHPRLSAELSTVVAREPMRLAHPEPVVRAVAQAAEAVLGHPTVLCGDIAWGDSGLLVEAGIPCVTFGPTGHGEHTAQEWVELASVQQCALVLQAAARAFCG